MGQPPTTSHKLFEQVYSLLACHAWSGRVFISLLKEATTKTNTKKRPFFVSSRKSYSAFGSNFTAVQKLGTSFTTGVCSCEIKLANVHVGESEPLIKSLHESKFLKQMSANYLHIIFRYRSGRQTLYQPPNYLLCQLQLG